MDPIYLETIEYHLKPYSGQLPVNPNEKLIIIVGGYWELGDGGGGTFLVCKGILQTGLLANKYDDGGLIIKSAQWPDVYYQRLVNTPYISVKWFGAKGHSGQNATPFIIMALYACKNYIGNLQTGMQVADTGSTYMRATNNVDDVSRTRIYFPAGRYRLDSPIAVNLYNNLTALDGTSLELIGENAIFSKGDNYSGGFAIQISAYLNVKISGFAFFAFREGILLNKAGLPASSSGQFVERASRVLIENCQFTRSDKELEDFVVGISVNLKHSNIEIRDITFRGVINCVVLHSGTVTVTGAWITGGVFKKDLDAHMIIYGGLLSLENCMFIPQGGKFATAHDDGIILPPTKEKQIQSSDKNSIARLDSVNEQYWPDQLRQGSATSLRQMAMSAVHLNENKEFEFKHGELDINSDNLAKLNYGAAYVKNMGGSFRAENVRFAGESAIESIVFNFAKGHKVSGTSTWTTNPPISITLKNCLCTVTGNPIMLFEIPNSVVNEDNYGHPWAWFLLAVVQVGNWQQKLDDMYGYFSIKVDNIPWYGTSYGNYQCNSVPRYLLPYLRINNGFDTYGHVRNNRKSKDGRVEPKELLFFLGKKSRNVYGAFSSLYGCYSYEIELLNLSDFTPYPTQAGEINEANTYLIKTRIDYNTQSMIVAIEPVTPINSNPLAPILHHDPSTNAITVSAADSQSFFDIYYQIRSLIPPVAAPYEI